MSNCIHCPQLQLQEQRTHAPALQVLRPTRPGICSPVLVTTLLRDKDKNNRESTKKSLKTEMIQGIRNHSYQQRLKDL